MMRQAELFGLSGYLKPLFAVGDPLETMERAVDFGAIRLALDAALAYVNGSKGSRPPYDSLAILIDRIKVSQA